MIQLFTNQILLKIILLANCDESVLVYTCSETFKKCRSWITISSLWTYFTIVICCFQINRLCSPTDSHNKESKHYKSNQVNAIYIYKHFLLTKKENLNIDLEVLFFVFICVIIFENVYI